MLPISPTARRELMFRNSESRTLNNSRSRRGYVERPHSSLNDTESQTTSCKLHIHIPGISAHPVLLTTIAWSSWLILGLLIVSMFIDAWLPWFESQKLETYTHQEFRQLTWGGTWKNPFYFKWGWILYEMLLAVRKSLWKHVISTHLWRLSSRVFRIALVVG